MRFGGTFLALRARIARPLIWAVPIAFSVFIWVPIHVLTPIFKPHAGGHPLLFGMPATVAFLGLWVAILSPMAWQWTGDDRPETGLLRGVGQCTILIALWAILLVVVGVFRPPSVTMPTNLKMMFTILLPFTLVLGVLYYPGYVIARWERLSEEARCSVARARELEWMGHRGTFSPALLFNNLDHLSGQVIQDPQGTESALLDLADLYRKWLMEAEHLQIPWGRERSITEQYLALEARRWGQPAKICWLLEPEAEQWMVPPLILIPFMEVILGLGGNHDFSIRISSACREEIFEILIQMEPSASNLPESLLAQTRLKIQSATGGRGDVSRWDSPEGTSIRICLPRGNPGGL